MALVMARGVEFALLPQIVPVVAHGAEGTGGQKFLEQARRLLPFADPDGALRRLVGVPGAGGIFADQTASLELFQLRQIAGEGAVTVKGEEVEVFTAILLELFDPAVVGAGIAPRVGLRSGVLSL